MEATEALSPAARIGALLHSAAPIGLEEMDGVALLNRVDRKYLLPLPALLQLLAAVLPHYRVLDIDGHRVFTYDTAYFDTPALQFYHDHHNGLANRVKVRCRQYRETSATFFEVKRKVGGYRTDKHRRPVPCMMDALHEADYADVHRLYTKHPFSELRLALHNGFRRATLVNLAERCTVDFGLCFSAPQGDMAQAAPFAVIEVKQVKSSERSPMVLALKVARIYPCALSKYVYGMMLTEPGLKRNAFKPTLRRIEKVVAGR